MLTIQPIKDANEAAGYYSNHDNYYLSDKESLKDGSAWLGKGAHALGLKGPIEERDFLELLKGHLPNGEVLGITIDGERCHRPGTDVTLSAPKSVSILALVGKDQRLIEAHQKAVLAVVDRLESMAAEARTTILGKTSYEKTRNLVIASFLHQSSRELDPQLHTHLAILNMTLRQDEKWRALSSREKKDVEHLYNGFREILYDNQHYFGLVYTSTLAKEVTDCGYDIEKVDRYGNFEVSSVPKELIKEFSKRSEDINKSLHDKEIVKNSKNAEIAALDTRKQKQSHSSESLHSNWASVAESHGVNLDNLISESKQPKDIKETSTEQKCETIISSTAKAAIKDSIEHLSCFNAKIHHADIIRYAFELSSSNVGHEELENTVKSLVEEKKLIKGDNNLYTSKHLLEKEQSFTQDLMKGNSHSFSIKSDSKLLDAEILSSKDRVQIVNVLGTSNERELLQGLVNTTEQDGKSAYILHPIKFQQNQLNRDITHDNSSVWKRIKNLFKDDVTNTVSGFISASEHNLDERGKVNKQDVVVVCDAQKLGFEEIEKLNSIAKKTSSKLILFNNENSTQGYRAGNPIKSLKDVGIRQHSSKSAIQKYECNLNSSNNNINDISKKYFKNYNLNKDSCVVALSKSEQSLLTKNIRARLKDNGVISQQEVNFKTLSTERLSDQQMKSPKFYSVGDLIIQNPFTKNQNRLYVSEKSGSTIFVTDHEGNKKPFDLSEKSKYIVQKSKNIDVAVGDTITNDSTSFISRQKIDKGTEFKVKGLCEDGLLVNINDKELFITNKEIRNTTFTHNYVKRPHQLNKKYDEIVLSAKSYQLNRQNIGELSEYLNREKSNIEIYSDDKVKSKLNLEKNRIKHTVHESVDVTKANPARNSVLLSETIKKDLDALYASLSIEQSTKSTADIATEAVSYALAKCHERESAVLHKELLTEALLHCLGKADSKDIIPVLQERLKEGTLLYCDTHWINEKELQLEKNIIKFNKEGQGKMAPIIADKNELLTINPKLTQGQKDAVFMALQNKDVFTTIQGFAGVGKTTMTKELKRFTDDKGIQIVGITPTNKAKEELESQGIHTRTVASIVLGDEEYKPGTVLILDEASMVGNHDYHQIQKMVIKNKCFLITTGDRTQNQSISSGVPHELNQDSKSQKVSHMTDIVRQNANPELKAGVYAASERDIEKAHLNLKNINPSEWVKRETGESTQSSIVEIAPGYDKETKEMDLSGIYSAISDDYLTRTKDCRDRTIVIAHANEDREEINQLIREGLQEKGEIECKNKAFDRYLSKDMTEADKPILSNYSKGDVLRFDANSSFARSGDYFYIKNVDKAKNIINCKSSRDNEHQLTIEDIKNSRFSVYENKPNNISVGEKIRLKRTDLSKGRTANDIFMVKSINNNNVVLQRNDIIHCLDLSKENDKHWDYAYSDTAYTIQGGTDKWVISLELSFRTKSTNWRSQLIDISRASRQHTNYTDNHEALVSRTNDTKKQIDNDKKSAFLVYSSYQKKIRNQRKLTFSAENINKIEQKKISYNQAKQGVTKPDLPEIESSLKAQSRELCHHLLGEPNKALSSSNNLRYGRKGSLSIQVKSGLWKNFETDESGNLFGLIKTELGMSEFKDAVKYAKEFLNMSEYIEPKIRKEAIKKSNQANSTTKKTAETLYKSSKPINDTPAQKYLNKHRNITSRNETSLRYVKNCYTYHGDKKTTVPALLAPTFDEKGKLNNIQVIRINPLDFNKDRQSKLKKQTLGPSNGYFCELNKNHNNGVTYIAEGVETGMSILEAKPEARVIVTFGVSNFKNIKFSLLGKDVCFCLDNDGDATYKNKSIHSGLKEAQNNNKNVSYIRPNKNGDDLNDELIRGGKKAVLKTIERPHDSKVFFSKFEKNELNKALIKENAQIKLASTVDKNSLEQASSQLKIDEKYIRESSISYGYKQELTPMPNKEIGERDL